MKIALSLPTFNNINNPPGFRFSQQGATDQTTLGYVLSQIFTIFFYVGGFLMFAYLTWGVFQYITARGLKEDLAKARSKITWSILGFILLIGSFFISQYVQTIFPLTTSKGTPVQIRQITPP